jgi:hypothetical protein
MPSRGCGRRPVAVRSATGIGEHLPRHRDLGPMLAPCAGRFSSCPARRIKRGRGLHYRQPFSRCCPGFAPWMCRARTSRDVRVATARKFRRCPEGWARGIPVSCWRLISGPSRGSEHIPTGRPFPMTGATRDHSGRSDPNGKHPYSPRLAAGQLPRGGMFVFRGCDSVKRRPTPPRSLSKGKCRKGRTTLTRPLAG